MPNDYALVRQQRKHPHIQMGPKKGPIERVEEPERDPMSGVTDPAKLLKSDTQRIDKNVVTPEQMWKAAPHGGGSEESNRNQIKIT